MVLLFAGNDYLIGILAHDRLLAASLLPRVIDLVALMRHFIIVLIIVIGRRRVYRLCREVPLAGLLPLILCSWLCRLEIGGLARCKLGGDGVGRSLHSGEVEVDRRIQIEV